MTKEVNAQWQFDTMAWLIANQIAGQVSVYKVEEAKDELEDLKKRKYISIGRKPDENGAVVLKPLDDVYLEDLVDDLGLPQELKLQIAPEMRKPVEQTDMTQATQAPTIAEAAPEIPAVPFNGAVAETAPQIQPMPAEVAEVAAQPTFHGNEQAGATGAVVVGAGVPTVMATVVAAAGEFALEVGVPFKVAEPSQKKAGSAAAERYPFSALVDMKLANPDQAPSFVVADKKMSNLSTTLKRASERYEESKGVTFRGTTEGTGVRVHALFVTEAPARRVSKKAAPAVDVQAAPVAE